MKEITRNICSVARTARLFIDINLILKLVKNIGIEIFYSIILRNIFHHIYRNLKFVTST